jgi:hypothetical protein
VNAVRKLVELIGESTQSGAGHLGLGSAGKPPQKRSVVVVAQSAFFRLLSMTVFPFTAINRARNNLVPTSRPG